MISPSRRLAPLALLACACGGAQSRTPGSVEVTDGVTYCVSYYDEFQAPRCDTPLTPEEQSRRWAAYRFTAREGRVVSLERINGNGRPYEDPIGESSWEYAYDGASKVPAKITARDALGEIVTVLVVSDGGKRIDFKDAWGQPRPRKNSNIVTRLYVLDEHGREMEQKNLNLRGVPTPDDDGVFVERYERDARGVISKATFIDASGAPTVDVRGCATRSYQFTDKGLMRSYRYADAKGAPCRNEDGVPGGDFELDDVGNRIKVTYVGADGKRAASKEGVAGNSQEFDAHGCVTKVSYFDVNGAPTHAKDGVAGWTATCDARGNRLSETYFDPSGKPTVRSDGVMSFKFEYDDHDLETRRSAFGPDGRPTLSGHEFSSVTSKHDAHGKFVEVRLLGLSGEPIYQKDRYTTLARKFDERGREIERRFLGAKDELVVNQTGYAIERTRYDEAGNAVEATWFDAKEAPVARNSGAARLVRAYDDLGDITSEAWFDAAGKPIPGGKEGHVRNEGIFDDRGLRTSAKFYDLGSDTPALSEKYTYDAWGRLVTFESFGPGGKPVAVSRTVMTYDEAGRETSRSGYGFDGKPIDDPDRASVTKKRYDEMGNVVWERTFGPDGKLMMIEGLAGYDATYDAYGRVVDGTTVGADGQPIATPDAGPRTLTRYDAYGRRIFMSFLDRRGKPFQTSSGFASGRFTYDAHGNRLTFSMFDADGWPTLVNKHQYHSWRKDYDARGRETATWFLDVKGATPDGMLVGHAEYDDRGSISVRFLTDKEGKLSINLENRAITRYEVDDRGRTTKESYFDASEKPVADRAGVAYRTFAYARNDEPTIEACFGIDGKPADNADGWSTMRAEEGPDGRLLRKVYTSKAGAVMKTDPPTKL